MVRAVYGFELDEGQSAAAISFERSKVVRRDCVQRESSDGDERGCTGTGRRYRFDRRIDLVLPCRRSSLRRHLGVVDLRGNQEVASDQLVGSTDRVGGGRWPACETGR